MGLIALLMTGAVLLMNGLVLLQIAEPRTVAIVNIWGGILQTFTPFVLLTQTHTPVEALGVGPPFLFGLTFLWVGVATLMDLPTVAIGWYCLWVVPVTVVLAIANVTIFADPRFAIVWLNYGMLWGLFWAVLALGRVNLARFTGWTAVFLAIWGVTAPAVLLLVGLWTRIPVWAFIALTIAAELLAFVLARSEPAMREREAVRA